MRFAQKEGERILPNPLEKDAVCPLCKNQVIAKCGMINVWHWSHKNLEECDSFKEPETEWHLNWKNEFKSQCQEVIIGEHRADVFINRIVIEFQNSPISPEDIVKREEFYGKMKWVLNGKTFGKNLVIFDKGEYYSFKWKWFPKSWSYSKKYIYIDMSFKYDSLLKDLNHINDKDDDDSFTKVVKHTVWQEYADGNSYPITEGICFDVKYGDEKDRLLNEMRKYKDKLFLIKRLSTEGTGWGKLISKKDFKQECEYGYYPN